MALAWAGCAVFIFDYNAICLIWDKTSGMACCVTIIALSHVVIVIRWLLDKLRLCRFDSEGSVGVDIVFLFRNLFELFIEIKLLFRNQC